MPALSSVTPRAWRSRAAGPEDPLPAALLARPAEEVARELLGSCIVSNLGGERTVGVVVETEAYVGPHDPASHAARRIGRTARNETMFRRGGLAYVYRIYGLHWCLNVVTGREGFPEAVLVRGLDPLEGADVMARRRGRPDRLCAGPGRLCQALGVTGELDGHALDRPPLRLVAGWPVDAEEVGVAGRVGVREAADWPLRFYVRGNPGVSRPAR